MHPNTTTEAHAQPPSLPNSGTLNDPTGPPPTRPEEDLHSSFYDGDDQDPEAGYTPAEITAARDFVQTQLAQAATTSIPAPQRARSCPVNGASSTNSSSTLPSSNDASAAQAIAEGQAIAGAGNQNLHLSGTSSDSDAADREEGMAGYRRGGFHPVRLGDVFHSRYKVLRKLGYGHYSTVWLVRDLARHGDARRNGNGNPGYYAMKVLKAECYDSETPVYEREILTHLRDANPHHAGYGSVCHLLDDFEHDGPNGRHVCLVFELMGETLQSYNEWFDRCRIPSELVKKICEQLLLALWYAHANGVIHTGTFGNSREVMKRMHADGTSWTDNRSIASTDTTRGRK